MNKYSHLFFDLDHTLWDFNTNSRESLSDLYNHFDLKSKLYTDLDSFISVYKYHNDKMWRKFRKGFVKREELRWKRMWHTILEYDCKDLKLAEDMSAYYIDILPLKTGLIEDAIDTLQYLKEKEYKLHIITNGFEETQKQKLHNSQLAPFFDIIVTSESARSMKPQEAIFDFALSATQSSKDEVLMIGDSMEADIIGAHQAGWHAVFFNPEKIIYKPMDNVIFINKLSELKNIL